MINKNLQKSLKIGKKTFFQITLILLININKKKNQFYEKLIKKLFPIFLSEIFNP